MVYTLAGFFLVPWVAERQIPAIAEELLERPVTVESVSFNPLVLSAEIRGLQLAENNGEDLISFDSLYANFQLSSLFRRAWTFAEIRLDGPALNLVRQEDGAINLAQILPAQEPGREQQPDGELPRLVIGEFSLNQGQLVFRDKTRTEEFVVPVAPIDFSFTNISTLPQDAGEHRLSASSEDGAHLVWRGHNQFAPLLLEGEIEAEGTYPELAYRYFQDLLNVQLTGGEAQLRLSYRLEEDSDGLLHARIDPAHLALSDLTALEPNGDPAFGVTEASLSGLQLHWPEQTVTAEALTLNGADLRLTRLANGQLSVEQWLAAHSEQPAPSITSAPPPLDATAEPFGGWTLALNRTRVQNLRVAIEDAALRKPGDIDISAINLELGRVTSIPDESFPLQLDLSLASGGQLELEGEARVLPSPTTELEYRLSDLALSAAQPWLNEFARITVDEGLLDMIGAIATTADNPFHITGELTLQQLGLSATATGEELLGWQSLALDHFDYKLEDNSLNLSLLTLSEPFARIQIDEEQNTNIGLLMVEPESKQKKDLTPNANNEPANGAQTEDASREAVPTAPPFSLVLGRVRIEDGTADFSDLSLPIPFKTWIAELNGSLDDLDSTSTEPASLSLEGQVDEYGLARIAGNLHPLQPTEQTDIELTFRNIAVPDLSPYTIAFAGRAIDEGRMDLDLGYRLENGQLRGSNNVVLHDLRLGERVAHEDAADLPLGLAVALLKGPDGRIRIDLPVEGDVNNPSFDFGAVIRNAITNLIARAATAPFRMLASLVGASGEDFGQLLFVPGSAQLTPPERQKVAKLAEALAQRPALGLRVAPTMAPAADRGALKRQAVEDRIEAAVAAGNGGESFTVRRRQELENLFREQFSGEALASVRQASHRPQDPDDPDGRQVLDNTRYEANLRSRLIEAEEVSGEALEQLAHRRVDTLKDLLSGGDGIDTQRIHVTAPTTTEPDGNNLVAVELEVRSLE